MSWHIALRRWELGAPSHLAESWDGRHAWGHGVAVVVCEVVGGLDDEVEVGVVVVFEGFGDVHGVLRFEAEFFGERAHAVVFA